MSNTKSRPRETLTTTISLGQGLHRRLKHLAVDRGVSVRYLVREALEEYLERHQKNSNSDEGVTRIR